MWVTQSYLGNPDEDPKVYAYYLFEDYNGEQESFTRQIEGKLAHVGDQFGPHATILMPNRHNTPRIEAEVRDALGEFWWELQGQLPGILVSTTKLSKLLVKDGQHHFFSLKKCELDSAFDVITSVHRLMQQCVEYQHKNQTPQPPETIFKRLLSSIEAKPGIYGFSVDLKRLFKK
ncbi:MULTISPECIES: hypothetical protein [Pseudomonas]|uniref:hypothetical protein n=1 Tax=Pseudomonas TaxID=286 RepID=UPI0008D60ECF|nr:MULTISPECIES: hypothetical protein [Pseudomonas]WLG68553.1 hypothetical protein PSH71_01775 [Pseudomonas brassicacearum]SEP18653.1 hypothetical protein SAMN03159293_05455 [Pseudomonas sp. NFACC39-1]